MWHKEKVVLSEGAYCWNMQVLRNLVLFSPLILFKMITALADS